MNVPWCARRGAVMVTNDRGKGDRIIRQLLQQHRVHAIFVYKELRRAELHVLARALLRAEPKIEQIAGKRTGLISHRLTENGNLTPRTKS